MDVITFGETMVLFNPESQGPLRYVGQFTKSIGGAESNVAIALARLGHRAGWFSRLGNDEFGRYIRSTIMGEDVDVSRVRMDDKRPTGILFKERFSQVNPNVYYYRKGSAASHLKPEDLDLPYLSTGRFLHVTGISLALSESFRAAVFAAVHEAKRHGVKISFDPNIRLKLWSLEEARRVMLEVIALSDIVFPGLDEAEMLFGLTDPKAICAKLHEMGPELVALKLGKDGCYISMQGEGRFVPGYPVQPVDTIGAGDGFAAGFLSGLLDGLAPEEAGKRANAVGAMATLVRGDMEGFPYREQVEIFMGLKQYIDR